MKMEYSELRLYNPGVITTRLPVRVFSEVTQDLQKQIDSQPSHYNSRLAGHIETELTYKVTSSLKDCLEDMCNDYKQRFDFYRNHSHCVRNEAWVNIQKKHEYNPLHLHYEDLSWVLWVHIPYDLDAELKQANTREANFKVASKFQFVYNKLDTGLGTHEINIDKTYEGMLMMFPSYLRHQVYSFQTSDDHRISLAGNITILDK